MAPTYVGPTTAYQQSNTIRFADRRSSGTSSYFFRVRGTITSGPTSLDGTDFIVGDDPGLDSAIGAVSGGDSDIWEFEGELLQVETSNDTPPAVFLNAEQINPDAFNDVGDGTAPTQPGGGFRNVAILAGLGIAGFLFARRSGD